MTSINSEGCCTNSNVLAGGAAFFKNAFQNRVRKGNAGPQTTGPLVCAVTGPCHHHPTRDKEGAVPHQQ